MDFWNPPRFLIQAWGIHGKWFLRGNGLCPLPRKTLWIFFPYLPGNFALKNGGDFWWIFSGLRFPRNEARELLEKFGENSEQNSGQNSGRKFEEFGELSFCNSSGLMVCSYVRAWMNFRSQSPLGYFLRHEHAHASSSHAPSKHGGGRSLLWYSSSGLLQLLSWIHPRQAKCAVKFRGAKFARIWLFGRKPFKPMYLVKPLSRDKGSGRYRMYRHPKEPVGRKGQIYSVSARPLVPGEGLYQIHGQSLNTHRGKHRSGGA